MSETVITALIAGLPAILLAIAALVKSFRSDKTAADANRRSMKAEEIAIAERNKRLLEKEKT